MPIRGLENTLPLHWDGTLGDPFGGGNGAVGLAGTPAPGHGCDPNDADGDHDCFLDLATGPGAGLHLLQVQNPSGLLSNEMPVCFGASSGCVSD
jgi:hypothetical protein